MNHAARQLALKKELLLLQLESHRLEIEAGVESLKHPLRGAAIGTSVLRLLRSHPILISGATALLARVPRLGFAVKIAAAAVAVWQTIRLIAAWRR